MNAATHLESSEAPITVPEPAPKGRRARKPIAFYLEAYSLLGLTLVAVIFFSFYPGTSSTFPTLANLQILLYSQAILGVVAIAVLIPLVTESFDLSVGAITTLVAIVTAKLLTSSMSPVFSLLIGILCGTAAGLANAIIVTKLRVNAVVATLGTATLMAGIILQITEGTSLLSNNPQFLTDFGVKNVFGIPIIFIALLVVAAGAWFLLEHNPFGRQLYAVGSNPNAARLVGVRVDRVRFIAFVVGGTLAGVAGLFYVANSGSADPKLAQTFLLPSFAAAFLSAAAIRPGQFNVRGMLVAIYFLAILNNGLNLAGAPAYVTQYINGAALIIGLTLAGFLSGRRVRS